MTLKVSDFIGNDVEEDFEDFNLTEVRNVLEYLAGTNAIDLAHAEMLQQKALRGADVLSDYLGRIVKTVSFLETKVNSVKNKAALEYSAPEGRTTVEMKKWAGESSPEVEQWQIRLAKAKGCKIYLEKKYEILIKSHHHYKDIAAGFKRTILGHTPSSFENKAESW